MSKRKVAITGVKGTVGMTLVPHLESNYDIIGIDLPEVDLRDYDQTRKALRAADTIIHLAGSYGTQGENWWHERRLPVNDHLFHVALQASIAERVKQFVHASTIHVENTASFMKFGFMWGVDKLAVRPPGECSPAGLPPGGLGRSKLEQEVTLAQTMQCGVDDVLVDGAVSIRLGTIVPGDKLPYMPYQSVDKMLEHDQRTLLTTKDLGRVFDAVLENPQPGYETFYAVSENPGRFHDISNNFGWQPA